MTPTEAVQLTGYIQAHFPSQPINEYTPDALGELLAPYPVADCRQAVLNLAGREKSWCAPSEVAAEVRRIRAKRIDDHPPLVPPPGLDDVQERRWLSEARRRVGDGEQIDSDAAYGELLTGAAVNFRELLPTPTTHPTPHAGATDDTHTETDAEEHA